ncbi:MAG: murein biosynthesis integral membrane protein MurJ [Actinobacteria bacterium]|nr:murein biosynthesis integral membrane protein MurJ [Actinomycetota bacterium]
MLAEPDDHREAFVRNTAVMSAGTALSRLTGFLRLSVAAWALGNLGAANAYNRANTTPNIIYELALGGILTSVFVPVFVEWLHTKGREEAWDVARRVLTLALVVLSTIAVLGGFLAPQIMRLYFSQTPDAEQGIALGTFLLRWFMPQVVFYGVGAVAGGLLNAHGRFAAPMFAPILNNLSVIATMIVFATVQGSPTIGALSLEQKILLGAGTTMGVAAMTLVLWPALRQLGFRWYLRFDWGHEAVRRLARLALWVVVYVVANQVAFLVVLVLSGREQDWFTIYSYAFILFQLPHAIFTVSIFTALLPRMSQSWATGDADGLRRLLSRGVRDMSVIVVPAALGYLALAHPITRVILQHGHFSAAATDLTARELQAFALGLPFFSAFQLLTRTFYAMQDSRTPALVNVAAAGVNIAANVFFLEVAGFGVVGLALGHAISYAFSSGVCVLVLRRRLGGVDGAAIARALARIVPAAVLTALAALGASEVVARVAGTATLPQQILQLSAAVLVGLLVFGASALIFGIREADDVRAAVLRRLRP